MVDRKTKRVFEKRGSELWCEICDSSHDFVGAAAWFDDTFKFEMDEDGLEELQYVAGDMEKVIKRMKEAVKKVKLYHKEYAEHVCGS